MTPFAAEEADDRIAIWTPDLRLRFTRVGDRWTHAIDLGPGPWQTVADAVEWSESDPESVLAPVYQELHLHHDDHGPAILAVGRVGAHHVSASFRLRYHTRRLPHPCRSDTADLLDEGSQPFQKTLQDWSWSAILIDIADRCRATTPGLEARYRVHHPPLALLVREPDEGARPSPSTPDWRDQLVWEAVLPDSHHVALVPAADPPGVRFAILDHRDADTGDAFVHAAPHGPPSGDTCRFAYIWSHNRVRSFDEREVPGPVPPWQLEGAIPPDDLTPVTTDPLA